MVIFHSYVKLPEGRSIYHLVIQHSHGTSPVLIGKHGKPSISMGHLYHGYVSHNQMVVRWIFPETTGARRLGSSITGPLIERPTHHHIQVSKCTQTIMKTSETASPTASPLVLTVKLEHNHVQIMNHESFITEQLSIAMLNYRGVQGSAPQFRLCLWTQQTVDVCHKP